MQQETDMADTPYYRQRAAQERKAAERSSCPEARRIHETMAARYSVLADGSELPLAA